MTRSSRTDSRKDYRHFPREYTDLLVAFERDGRATLTFSTRREASTARRLLYQFKMLATSSLDADPEDAQARWLVDVFNTCTLRLEPSTAAGAEGTYSAKQADPGATVLILDTNPLVRAMRARAVPSQAPAREHSPATPSQAEYDRAHVKLGCAYPAACRSTFHGSPAFCECGTSEEPSP